MTSRSINVIGGGPAGLFSAQLIKTAHPDWTIDLYENLPSTETFGFGIGLTGALLEAIQQADETTHAELLEAGLEFSTAAFVLPTESVEISGFHRGVSIQRKRLVQVLQDGAVRAGVRVHQEFAPPLSELLEADLVIAADGVSSGTRSALAKELGATTVHGRGLFIWCGSNVELSGTEFVPVTTEHGTFVAHAYPYAPGKSTLVIETDRETWKRAGLDQWTPDSPSSSDKTGLAYLSRAFESLLRGTALVGNKSRWSSFRTVQCERWSHENVVLIGDAAASAHPSLGSGTKLALESAIALARSLDDPGLTIHEALAHFEKVRRPYVDRLQQRAIRSQLWWESFPSRLDLAPSRLAVAYLTRAGAVTMEDLNTSAPKLVGDALREYLGAALGSAQNDIPAQDGQLQAWILSRPFASSAFNSPGRVIDRESIPADACVVHVADGDAWGPDGDRVRRQVEERSEERFTLLTGQPGCDAVMDRVTVAERIRRECRSVVAVTAREQDLPAIADALVAGRIDLAVMEADL